MNIDLHTHTTASDGLYTPEKLVNAALRKKVNLLSVTDHDTIASLAEVKKLCEEKGLAWISGIEISCHAQGEEIHILAYGFDPQSAILNQFISTQNEDRQRRLQQMIVQLQKANVKISWEDVKRYIHSESAAGRPHVARALVYAGYATTMDYAFSHYLTPGKIAYVPRQTILAKDVLEMIGKMNAVSVLAHPVFIKNENILEELFEQGLQGIEAFHPGHKGYEKKKYESWALERKLFVTGGSDFHGDKGKGHGILGAMKIPEEHIKKIAQHFL